MHIMFFFYFSFLSIHERIPIYKHFIFSGSRLTRKTPASYADGVYMMAGADRPGARTLSKLFMRGQDGLPSLANRTSLLAFFGE